MYVNCLAKTFYHSIGPVKLVQANFSEGKVLDRRFNRRGGAVKHVQVCSCAWKYLESSFHNC